MAEAAELQRRILGYFQNRVGRGALYNQMWHDYAIAGSPPDHDPEAGPFDALYDGVRDHFARERIYAPAIDEVIAKLHLAQRSRFTAQWSGDTVTTSLDLSRLLGQRARAPRGHGPAGEPAGRRDRRGRGGRQPHPAFSADTVILPPATGASLVVKVTTG